MRFLFYWRTKQKKERRVWKDVLREKPSTPRYIFKRFFAPKAALAGTSGAMSRGLLVVTLKRKSGTCRNIGGNATQIACENFERKSGACRNIGGNVTQIAFGKYERKSGVCRNVWEDAKV